MSTTVVRGDREEVMAVSDGEHSEREWKQAAQWAEHEMRLPTGSVTARRGADATQVGRRLLARAQEQTR